MADLSEKAPGPAPGAGASAPGSSHDTDVSAAPTPNNNEKSPGGGGSALDLSKIDSKVVVAKNETDNDPYAHLPEREAKILKDQVYTPDVKVGIATLYRYSSRNDILIMVVSAICAIASGAALPLMTVVFGNLQGTFQSYFTPNSSMSYDDFVGELSRLVLYFVYLGIAEFVTTYVATVGFIYTGEHISAKIREHYLESCMKQNIGFFDKLGAGEVTTRITADTNLIQEGISEKVSLTLAAVATFVAAFVIGFVTFWKLTLILISTVVALLLCMGTGSTFIVKFSRQNISAYAEGGSVAEEVISSIRNAVAFGTQDRLAKQYDTHLTRAEFFGFRLKGTLGIMVAGMMCILYLNYGLAFWSGSRFLVDRDVSLSNLLIVMMSVMIGAFNLGNVAPNLQAFTTALGAAAKIYSTIDRISPIDPSSQEGTKLEKVVGTIRLERIKHIYPSRPEVVVMDDVSLTIPAGKTTALVGASGSGKSTIIGLVERFYTPIEGAVYLDGVDISTLNLRWLRQQIALVSQEPTLFSTTIYDNIRHGLIGTKWENESPEKQEELIHEAAKKANAHDFITSLPEGYQTNVGERGFLLSGGQKQRIAIARAIVSDPKILLLDEATSALDTKSEGVVQAALEVASEGRTTIVIAHRLSTIRDAHNIVVMSQGRIVEQGTHDELLERRGAYYNLVTAQAIAKINEATAEEQEAIDAEDEAALIRKASSLNNKEAAAGVPGDPDDDIRAKLQRSQSQASASSMALAGRKTAPETKYSLWTLIKLIASFNKEEWHLMLVGLFFSAICGGGNPAQAVFFAKLISALYVPLLPPWTMKS
jgi:ATP-binding cassette subfamily B (MDR/TAP) protein 1